jgi:hypothetical protein
LRLAIRNWQEKGTQPPLRPEMIVQTWFWCDQAARAAPREPPGSEGNLEQ